MPVEVGDGVVALGQAVDAAAGAEGQHFPPVQHLVLLGDEGEQALGGGRPGGGQTVNVIGCIKTTKTDAFLDTTAYPLMLYRKHFGTKPVEVDFEASSQSLDVAAALSEDGKTLTIGVVNPSSEPVQLKFNVDGVKPGQAATQWIVAGTDPRATNDADNDRIKAEESAVEFDGDWELPGFSFGILSIPLK